MITRLSINEQGRDWIVGDIRGELVLLKQLLDDIQFDPGCDRLISVGDLIDRGPDSPGVLRLFDSSSWFHAVMGNHDALACLCMQHREFRYEHLWHSNGGDWYSRLRSETEAAALARIVSGLKACIEIPLADGRVIGVIHGEIAVGYTWIVQVGHGRPHRGIVHAPGVFRSMDMARCRYDGLGDGTKVKKRRVRTKKPGS